MCQALRGALAIHHLIRPSKGFSLYGKTDLQPIRGGWDKLFKPRLWGREGEVKSAWMVSLFGPMTVTALTQPGPTGYLSHFKEQQLYPVSLCLHSFLLSLRCTAIILI